jgi:hypothetical protein
VTLSAPGILFGVDSPVADGASPGAKTVYSLGTATVQTNAAGAFAGVEVYSNTAGKVNVTVTSGAASQVVTLVFDDAGPTTGANLVIDAPSSVVPGGTAVITGVLTDKWGNPVQTDGTATIAYSKTAGGVLLGTLPTNTDADGKFSASYFFGTNERGTFTVTFSYSPTASATTFTGDDDIVVQKTITIGAAPAGEARAWTRFLDATDELKIYARDVVNAGKITFVVNGTEIAWIRATSAADPKLNVASDGMVRSVFVSDMAAGRNVIEIFEDGVRIERRIFTND